jgi:hypothetical protein
MLQLGQRSLSHNIGLWLIAQRRQAQQGQPLDLRLCHELLAEVQRAPLQQ